jgi:hypothetical protein
LHTGFADEVKAAVGIEFTTTGTVVVVEVQPFDVTVRVTFLVPAVAQLIW